MKPRDVVESEIGGCQGSNEAEDSCTPAVDGEIPREGRSWTVLHAELLARKADDYQWRAGRVPLYVYYDSDELLSVAREAYNLYFTENALGGRAFPSVARMEREIIRMSLSLFHAPAGADGSFTSGGTESLFLILKCARDHFWATHPGTPRPRIVVPRTAHPAIDKAAHYLGIDVIRVGVDTDLRVNVSAVENAIDARTVLICGSAPCYPYGVYDSIRLLGEVATRNQVWLHVDACLGGFLAPFARDEGYAIPDFDFLTPGVTSLSADLHKYGFSAKGASVLLYRSGGLKRWQDFRFDDWPRGTYATDTFLGSRPGGAVASAWAVLHHLGQSGYRQLARKTMAAKRRLVEGIERIPGLQVVRPSELSILLYRSIEPTVDINAVAEVLGQKGWFVGRTREPQALHFALNAVHVPIVDEYLSDLEYAVREAQVSGKIGAQDHSTY